MGFLWQTEFASDTEPRALDHSRIIFGGRDVSAAIGILQDGKLKDTRPRARVLCPLEHGAGSLVVHGATVLLQDGHLVAKLGPDAKLERSDREFTFGFEAKNVSEEVRATEPEDEGWKAD